MKRLAQLLVFLSMLMSPLAMQPVAAAQPHHGMASMPSHCHEQGPAQKKAMSGDCSMACASALPAMDLPVAETAVRMAIVTSPIFEPALRGLTPEAATPPPRSA